MISEASSVQTNSNFKKEYEHIYNNKMKKQIRRLKDEQCSTRFQSFVSNKTIVSTQTSNQNDQSNQKVRIIHKNQFDSKINFSKRHANHKSLDMNNVLVKNKLSHQNNYSAFQSKKGSFFNMSQFNQSSQLNDQSNIGKIIYSDQQYDDNMKFDFTETFSQKQILASNSQYLQSDNKSQKTNTSKQEINFSLYLNRVQQQTEENDYIQEKNKIFSQIKSSQPQNTLSKYHKQEISKLKPDYLFQTQQEDDSNEFDSSESNNSIRFTLKNKNVLATRNQFFNDKFAKKVYDSYQMSSFTSINQENKPPSAKKVFQYRKQSKPIRKNQIKYLNGKQQETELSQEDDNFEQILQENFFMCRCLCEPKIVKIQKQGEKIVYYKNQSNCNIF